MKTVLVFGLSGVLKHKIYETNPSSPLLRRFLKKKFTLGAKNGDLYHTSHWQHTGGTTEEFASPKDKAEKFSFYTV